MLVTKFCIICVLVPVMLDLDPGRSSTTCANIIEYSRADVCSGVNFLVTCGLPSLSFPESVLCVGDNDKSCTKQAPTGQTKEPTL